MGIRASDVLDVLDHGRKVLSFPDLGHAYIYFAAARLSLYRSPGDWALGIEVFGYPPRSARPETTIYMFASAFDRAPHGSGESEASHRERLALHPNDEVRRINPISNEADWMDDIQYVAASAREVTLRGRKVALPRRSDYEAHDIALAHAERVQVHELCRYLAVVARDDVLATPSELRQHLPPELALILRLDAWSHPPFFHPDFFGDRNAPSSWETYQLLAQVLETGDVGLYRPTLASNTHWRDWPDSGTL